MDSDQLTQNIASDHSLHSLHEMHKFLKKEKVLFKSDQVPPIFKMQLIFKRFSNGAAPDENNKQWFHDKDVQSVCLTWYLSEASIY